MPTRADIKPDVIHVLAAVAWVDESSIKEPSKLFEDLGLGPLVRKALSVPFSEISRQYESGKNVSQAAAGKLKTVKESIDLVLKRAKGDE